MTDKWFPKLLDVSKEPIVVSGSLIDKTGENRNFIVAMTKDGIIIKHRSWISPKMVT